MAGVSRAAVGFLWLLGAAVAAHAAGLPSDDLEEVTVTARRAELIGAVESASQGTVTRKQIETRPILRTGELLETVPGLVVTQHSGDGKANQFFLRGFNLDHGTDFTTRVDGVPVNMPTHAHGQGYTDINSVIPELLDRIEYKKGTYYADEGNFSAAGAIDLQYLRRLDRNLLAVTGGEDDFARGLLAASTGVGRADLLVGLEYADIEGPWVLDENLRRINAIARVSSGDRKQGYSLTLSAYDGEWTATDQIPERAVLSGDLDRFGFVDPTNGGESHRYSIAADGAYRFGDWQLRGNAYALDYQLDLFSNFTYATDLVNGDQFEQFDDRRVYGGRADLAREYSVVGVTASTRFGVEVRHDDIARVGLYRTQARARLSTVREDSIARYGYSAFVEQSARLAPWLRAVVGVRFDRSEFDVTSDLRANSGRADDEIVSPKVALVLGPWEKTEFFVNVGRGFHENDARGATISVDPTDGVTPAERVRPLVAARGAEVGLRSALAPRTQVAFSLWALELDSELVYIGDGGTTEPNRASKRRGVELAVYAQPLDWLTIDADFAASRARFAEFDPAGDRIPGAVGRVVSLGAAVQHPSGWFGGARFRHFGAAPLTEDGSVRSNSTTVVNAEVGYRFSANLSVALSGLNLFDARDNDITYFYESQLAGEAEPVADRHFHPVEPRTARLTLKASW